MIINIIMIIIIIIIVSNIIILSLLYLLLTTIIIIVINYYYSSYNNNIFFFNLKIKADADGATEITDLPKLLEKIKIIEKNDKIVGNVGMVVGSRLFL
jgi:hypothetical protein